MEAVPKVYVFAAAVHIQAVGLWERGVPARLDREVIMLGKDGLLSRMSVADLLAGCLDK